MTNSLYRAIKLLAGAVLHSGGIAASYRSAFIANCGYCCRDATIGALTR
jgi:hypothetical protein